eukprot:2281700-Amphidinium_carterae.2
MSHGKLEACHEHSYDGVNDLLHHRVEQGLLHATHTHSAKKSNSHVLHRQVAIGAKFKQLVHMQWVGAWGG